MESRLRQIRIAKPSSPVCVLLLYQLEWSNTPTLFSKHYHNNCEKNTDRYNVLVNRHKISIEISIEIYFKKFEQIELNSNTRNRPIG